MLPLTFGVNVAFSNLAYIMAAEVINHRAVKVLISGNGMTY